MAYQRSADCGSVLGDGLSELANQRPRPERTMTLDEADLSLGPFPVVDE